MTDNMYAFLDNLDLAGLLDLQAAVDALVAERLAQDLGSTDPHQNGDMLPKSGGDLTSRPRGWVELKTINDCGPYAYLRWREGRRCRSKYLGKVRKGVDT